MAKVKLSWQSLLNITELDFDPESLGPLTVSDNAQIVISLMTAATRHDRKLLRCDEHGALLTSNAWSLMSGVETDELNPVTTVEDSYVASVEHEGILVSSGSQLIKAVFNMSVGVPDLTTYIPANSYYWYPHPVYSVDVAVVPDPGGTASYVGITAYK